MTALFAMATQSLCLLMSCKQLVVCYHICSWLPSMCRPTCSSACTCVKCKWHDNFRFTRWMQGIEGEREQAEYRMQQCSVLCKSRILALSTHAMSRLRVPALSLLTAISSNVRYIVSLWSADCESSIACCMPAQLSVPASSRARRSLSSRLSSKPLDSCSPFA